MWDVLVVLEAKYSQSQTLVYYQYNSNSNTFVKKWQNPVPIQFGQYDLLLDAIHFSMDDSWIVAFNSTTTPIIYHLDYRGQIHPDGFRLRFDTGTTLELLQKQYDGMIQVVYSSGNENKTYSLQRYVYRKDLSDNTLGFERPALGNGYRSTLLPEKTPNDPIYTGDLAYYVNNLNLTLINGMSLDWRLLNDSVNPMLYLYGVGVDPNDASADKGYYIRYDTNTYDLSNSLIDKKYIDVSISQTSYQNSVVYLYHSKNLRFTSGFYYNTDRSVYH